VSNSSISNTHVPLKLKADSNAPVEQSERVVSKEEGREYIQRYYIPDPTIKEKDTRDCGSIKQLQPQPQRMYDLQNRLPVTENTKKVSFEADLIRDGGHYCKELEDDTPSESKNMYEKDSDKF